MSEWKRNFIRSHHGFPIHRPYADLTDDERKELWKSINEFFAWVESRRQKVQYRVMLARYRGKTVCPECGGSRLRKEAGYVKVGDATISELVRMPVDRLSGWFGALELEPTEAKIAERLLVEIRSRLNFLCEVGLGYLTLDRLSNSLSGGESQRINLATSLGSSLVGSLYILDEPSIGLHPRDTDRLISVLRKLQRLGNTVAVVEHDEEIMRAADYIIDVGPDAGRHGGEIVYACPVDGIARAERSYTAKYLDGRMGIEVPRSRRRSASYIEVQGAREHNLKNIDVRFPLGVMTVVTGVSGSGKSTLVRDVLYRALSRRLGLSGDAPGAFKGLGGDVSKVEHIEFVDQNPIGRSTRSNPATYLKAYDEIRQLFAEQQASKQMGFTPATFSFNTEGGRCEECKGEGVITIEMQFLADVTIVCEECHGQRFKREVLEVQYRGVNIADVLDMTVDRAIEFFGEDEGTTARRIVRRLQPLHDVGLGYIKLGQSSSTLSGGENQRVKLAYFMSQDSKEKTMFIFDEPTTGLHNLYVIKCADHVIDIGPEGGDAGGMVVAQGTPEQVAQCEASYTGRYLREKLNA